MFFELGSIRIAPFTPKSDQFQFSPAASLEILYIPRRWTWVFISSLLRWKMIVLQILTTSLTHLSLTKVWENVLLELGGERLTDSCRLSSRKGGANKLIRILHHNGRYGFSQPLIFLSVTELVTFYMDKSLVQYNASLDVKLSNPLPRYKQVSFLRL